MYPLNHGVEVGSTVQLHVLLFPGGRGLECGGGEGERGECGEEGGGKREGGKARGSVEERERRECIGEGEESAEGRGGSVTSHIHHLAVLLTIQHT